MSLYFLTLTLPTPSLPPITQRITAADALAHPWFTEAPLPTAIDMMPMVRSRSQEIEDEAEEAEREKKRKI